MKKKNSPPLIGVPNQGPKTMKIRLPNLNTPPSIKDNDISNREEDAMLDRIEALNMFNALLPEMRTALINKDPRKMLNLSVQWALANMVELATNTTSDAVRYNALKDLLDRAGYKPPEKSVIMDMTSMTDGEIDAKITSLLKELDPESARQAKDSGQIVEGRASSETRTEEKDPSEEPAE